MNEKLKAIDFFCGGGGMSYGLKKAKIKIVAGIDYDIKCKDTYQENIKGAKFINADVFKLDEVKLTKKLGVKRKDNSLVLICCSPCQYWSNMQTNKEKSKKSKNLLSEFHRFVQYLKPGYIVVENVPGIFRRKSESGLNKFIKWLEENNYNLHYDVHDISEYGVPQKRKRFTLIANRVTNDVITPKKKRGNIPTVRDFIGEENGFQKVKAGHKDKTNFNHTVAGLNELTLKRIKAVKKDGGNRFDFANNPELQLDCFIGRENSFTDTFGRLWWDKPSPTITTKFFSVSNGRFVHPDENRALSLREGAVLQSFPKSFKFKTTSIADTARIIGNAVPPEYARRIGQAIKKNHDGNQG